MQYLPIYFSFDFHSRTYHLFLYSYNHWITPIRRYLLSFPNRPEKFCQHNNIHKEGRGYSTRSNSLRRKPILPTIFISDGRMVTACLVSPKKYKIDPLCWIVPTKVLAQLLTPVSQVTVQIVSEWAVRFHDRAGYIRLPWIIIPNNIVKIAAIYCSWSLLRLLVSWCLRSFMFPCMWYPKEGVCQDFIDNWGLRCPLFLISTWFRIVHDTYHSVHGFLMCSRCLLGS